MNAALIGENAGLIWNALQEGALSLKALKKATKLKEADLNLALGWLARENKIILKRLRRIPWLVSSNFFWKISIALDYEQKKAQDNVPGVFFVLE